MVAVRYPAQGIVRRRHGRGFAYQTAAGHPVHDRATLARIRALAIPPAWTDVWIAADPDAHLQATGYDARGRKQYRYHPRWRAIRDAVKYDRVVALCRALPRIRAAVARDLARPALICRSSYVHPQLLEDYAAGRLGELASRVRRVAHGATCLDVDVLRRIEPAVAAYLSAPGRRARTTGRPGRPTSRSRPRAR